MSAALGTLVIAISTEFSVLLSERFRQERGEGHAVPAALSRAYESTGSAVLASGFTAIMGFAVLVLSSITMLRDFGFVTLIDLSVSLAGVLVVLPAVLVLSERGELAEAGRPERPACWPGCRARGAVRGWREPAQAARPRSRGSRRRPGEPAGGRRRHRSSTPVPTGG